MPTLSPVFYDPKRRRGTRATRLALACCTALVAIYSIGLWSIATLPHQILPVGIAPVSTISTAHFISFHPELVAAPALRLLPVFYDAGNDLSRISLQQHVGQISELIPDWLSLSAQGGITEPNPDDERKVAEIIGKHQVRIKPLLSNDSGSIDAVIETAAGRLQLVKQLTTMISARGWSGISLDFGRQVGTKKATDRSDFFRLLTKQSKSFAQTIVLIQPASAIDGQPELEQYADQVLITLYDQHWSGSEPGAVAAAPWVKDVVKSRMQSAQSSKYTFILANYGYDWSHGIGTPVNFQAAIDRLAAIKKMPIYDPVSGSQHLQYLDERNIQHELWYADALSLVAQIRAIGPGATKIGLWEVGSEDPAAWQVLDGTAPLSELSRLKFSYDLRYEGTGEVSTVLAQPGIGRRDITLALDGSAAAVTTTSLPSSLTIQRHGAESEKLLALTFDDGPDPTYTPQILDVLEQHGVAATFFIVGSSAVRYPKLVSQIYDSGHELGNHTYYHSNVAVISSWQLQMEVSATERAIESLTGHRSNLFRPPYAIDGEPQTERELQPLSVISRMGYQTVGMGIDPNDWRAGRSAEQITNAVLSEAKKSNSNVILLHDSGGNRQQTVLALPKIIDGLQAAGYRLVTVSELIGSSRAAAMPAITRTEQSLGKVNRLGYWLSNVSENLIYALFILSIALGLIRLAGIASFALRHKRQGMAEATGGYLPTVAIVIPAYNEATVILRTIEAALATRYVRCKVVVIDDGSKDGTFDVLTKQFPNFRNLILLSQENTGKASALNTAIKELDCEIVVTIDADTLIHPDAVTYLVRHFRNPKVSAVAGNAKVGNRLNLLTRWQALEYVMGQNLDRRAFAWLNCICVVPGAIGAWRRSELLKAGGFTEETLAEDTDLTLQLLEDGGRITYEERALAFTEAPETIVSFSKQRFRWVYGTIQAMWKHRHTLFCRRYRALGMVALPNMLIFQVLLPLLGPLMDFLMLESIAVTLLQRAQHPESYSNDSVRKIFIYYVFFLGLELITGITAFCLERQEDWRLLLWIPAQRFFYRQILYYSVVRSVLAAIGGKAVGWNKFARSGSVRSGEG